MWTWHQKDGKLTRDGKFVCFGYSGAGEGKNNPAMQGIRAVGPIPRGDWKIGRAYRSENTGPMTIPLYALDGQLDDKHQPTGRSAFRIHGDSIKNPGTASRGCIILPRSIREKMWRSGDRDLRVVE